MTLTFVSSAICQIGTPLHVTVYLNGVPLDPAINPVVWSSLNATTSVSADAAGYNFNSTVIGTDAVTATLGQSSGGLAITFTAPPLQFTVP